MAREKTESESIKSTIEVIPQKHDGLTNEFWGIVINPSFGGYHFTILLFRPILGVINSGAKESLATTHKISGKRRYSSWFFGMCWVTLVVIFTN